MTLIYMPTSSRSLSELNSYGLPEASIQYTNSDSCKNGFEERRYPMTLDYNADDSGITKEGGGGGNATKLLDLHNGDSMTLS